MLAFNRAVPIVGDVWGKFRRELKLFEAFEVHTRLLGWDEKWIFMEHRFISQERVVGVVIMRGLFRSAKGTIAPAEFIRELGLAEQTPAMPDWLVAWSQSCDGLSLGLRLEEGEPPR